MSFSVTNMIVAFLCIIAFASAFMPSVAGSKYHSPESLKMSSFYDISEKDSKGSDVSFSKFKGILVLKMYALSHINVIEFLRKSRLWRECGFEMWVHCIRVCSTRKAFKDGGCRGFALPMQSVRWTGTWFRCRS